MKVVDHSVSKELFELLYHEDLDLYQTIPVPDIDTLPQYYKSPSYISHTDASQSFFDKIYQFVKFYTISSKVNLVRKYVKQGKKILDIGCGTGDFLNQAAKKNWEVVGVEPNEQASQLAMSKLQEKAIIYPTLESLLSNASSIKYDAITLWHVLEHVPNYDDYIRKIQSVLAPDGVLVVAVPNFKSYDAQHYLSDWAAYDVPRHLWHFSRKAIKQIFENHHLQVTKTLPMYFDSFYVSALSEKYRTGKMNYFKAFCMGLFSNFKAMASGDYSSQIYIIKRSKN